MPEIFSSFSSFSLLRHYSCKTLSTLHSLCLLSHSGALFLHFFLPFLGVWFLSFTLATFLRSLFLPFFPSTSPVFSLSPCSHHTHTPSWPHRLTLSCPPSKRTKALKGKGKGRNPPFFRFFFFFSKGIWPRLVLSPGGEEKVSLFLMGGAAGHCFFNDWLFFHFFGRT